MAQDKQRTREFTEAWLLREFLKRYMKGTPEKRKALIHALEAADACAEEALDAQPALPLLDVRPDNGVSDPVQEVERG